MTVNNVALQGYYDFEIEKYNKDFILGENDYNTVTEAAHIIPFAYNRFDNDNQVCFP